MALSTTTDGGGSTVSFTNAPQAQTDSYTTSEDATVAGSIDGVVFFNVLSNDLGGNAKTLYSIDDGDVDGSITAPNADGDLLVKDGIGVADTSALGARIWITADNKIAYDTTSPAIEALAAGETKSDSFLYAIQLGNGTLSWAKVTVLVTGSNDGPTVSLTTAPQDIHERPDTTGDTTHNDGATATIGFADLDLIDTHTLSQSGPSINWSTGAQLPDGLASALSNALSLTLHDSTGTGVGSVDAAFSAPDATFDFLAAGEHLTIRYDVTVTDNNHASATQTVTFTVYGANDAPVVAAALTDHTNEGDAAHDLDLLSGASDPDDGETALLSVTGVTYTVDGVATGHDGTDLPAGFSLSGATLHVDPSDPAYNHLSVSESTQVAVSYTVSDGHGGTVAQTETVTIQGTNDNPTVLAPLTDHTNEGDLAHDLDLLVGASDPDDGDTALLSVTGVTYTVDGVATGHDGTDLPAGFSLSGAMLHVDPSDPAYNHLSSSESTQVAVSYTVSDGHGGTVAQTETVTIQGTNDAPVLNAQGGSLAYTQNQAAAAIDTAITASDVDNAMLHGATVQITGNYASGQDVLGFTDQNGITGNWNASTGTLTLSGDAAVSSYQTALASVTFFSSSASTATRTVSYQADDGQAADHLSNIVTADVTVAAGNHAPVNLTFTPNATNGQSIGTFLATDPDSGDAITYSADHGISINSGTGAVTGLTQNFAGVVTVTATDSHGASTSLQYNVAIGNSGNNASLAVSNSGGLPTISAGLNGDDTIHGTSGNDYMWGGNGFDVFYSGDGNDYMSGGGGTGINTYNFDTALNAATNLDHIADFAAGTDKVGLSSTIFGLLPNTLSSTNLETVHGNVLGTTGANLVYDADSGTLYYDANGASAAGGRTAFVVFDNHAVVHVGDFFMF